MLDLVAVLQLPLIQLPPATLSLAATNQSVKSSRPASNYTVTVAFKVTVTEADQVTVVKMDIK